jgi:hypothetical protein
VASGPPALELWRAGEWRVEEGDIAIRVRRAKEGGRASEE